MHSTLSSLIRAFAWAGFRPRAAHQVLRNGIEARLVPASALLIALALALSPVTHQAPPPDVPAWVLVELCGETDADGHPQAPCPFCLLHAGCALLSAPGTAPIRLARRHLTTLPARVRVPPSPQPQTLPPPRGPPDQPEFA